ncbi:hypothetical protein K458DRAFT_387819 [Lentithecium fluviatile CBS 122367]|uniref:Uncharacterized protein n=1 Tax=Lentithecium fluviatile CBS 122367 TaxID=1168545 RepID=A0A6G1J5S1_9PLEO|nr:hypothetical protein K458DRAFT_387819 [Lentithecium fluviatile CBS 122367]
MYPDMLGPKNQLTISMVEMSTFKHDEVRNFVQEQGMLKLENPEDTVDMTASLLKDYGNWSDGVQNRTTRPYMPGLENSLAVTMVLVFKISSIRATWSLKLYLAQKLDMLESENHQVCPQLFRINDLAQKPGRQLSKASHTHVPISTNIECTRNKLCSLVMVPPLYPPL